MHLKYFNWADFKKIGNKKITGIFLSEIEN